MKNFHKSKIDGLQKLSTLAPQFYDFLQFKGCSYLNHKISFILSVQAAIFLVFHNPFMMLFYILSPILDHELMLDNFLITSSVRHCSLLWNSLILVLVSLTRCRIKKFQLVAAAHRDGINVQNLHAFNRPFKRSSFNLSGVNISP